MNPVQIAHQAVEVHRAEQKVGEFAALLALLMCDPPARILEIGNRHGGSMWAFRQVAPDARIVGVDVNAIPSRWADVQVRGDSRKPATVAKAVKALNGPLDFLHIDGDHNLSTIETEMELYVEALKPKLVAVHDVLAPLQDWWRGVCDERGDTLTLISDPCHHHGRGVGEERDRDEPWAGIGILGVAP